MPAPHQPTQTGQAAALPPPPSTSSAKGMTARPPNCSSEPIQMKGTRRQPSAERWVSERKPMSARNGAYSTGSATITATSVAGTFSSTIITRLSVPTSSVSAMPTETWNSDSRSSRDSGRSGVAASAKGRKRGPSWDQRVISVRLSLFMTGRTQQALPLRARARSGCQATSEVQPPPPMCSVVRRPC